MNDKTIEKKFLKEALRKKIADFIKDDDYCSSINEEVIQKCNFDFDIKEDMNFFINSYINNLLLDIKVINDNLFLIIKDEDYYAIIVNNKLEAVIFSSETIGYFIHENLIMFSGYYDTVIFDINTKKCITKFLDNF